MITVAQALKIILDKVEPLGVESVPLETAEGRILAEEVLADIDLPPFDRSRMDGFAVRSVDAASAPVRLNLIGEIAAGASFDGRVGPGEAVKIFTGAPLPAGADSVQKVEVARIEDRFVYLDEPVRPGQFVTPRSSEVKRGNIVGRSGGRIDPAMMAVLASFGYSSVRVGKRPRVAVISTGSELVPVNENPTAAQIRNSNSYALSAYAARAGANVVVSGIVEDTAAATLEALRSVAASSDMVITSGGVSMGDYDLVKAALVDLGAEIFFDRVTIRPGKPTVFARGGDTYFVGLPGNPVSTSVTFNVFARPALLKMQGADSCELPTVKAELTNSLGDPSSRRSFLPARISVVEGRARVEPLKWGGSSDLVAFRDANALIVVPESTHSLETGDLVEVFLLNAL